VYKSRDDYQGNMDPQLVIPRPVLEQDDKVFHGIPCNRTSSVDYTTTTIPIFKAYRLCGVHRRVKNSWSDMRRWRAALVDRWIVSQRMKFNMIAA
jgi:hypothetical protein